MPYGKTNYKTTKKAAKTAGKGPGPEVCKYRNFGDPCKLCKQVEKLNMSDDEADRTIASQCRAKGTYYMTIIDLKNKNAGRQLYGCNITNWKTLIDLLPDPDDLDSEGIDFTSVKKPFPVIMKKSGKGLNTSYTVTIGRSAIKLPPSLLKKKPIDLDNVIELLEKETYDLWRPESDKTSKIFIFPPWSPEGKEFYKEIFYHWKSQLLGLGDDDEKDVDDGDDEEWEDETDDGDEELDEDDDGDEEDDGYDDDDADEEEDDDDDDDDDGETVPEFEEMSSVQLKKFANAKKLKIKNIKVLKGSKLRKIVEKTWRRKYDVPF